MKNIDKKEKSPRGRLTADVHWVLKAAETEQLMWTWASRGQSGEREASHHMTHSTSKKNTMGLIWFSGQVVYRVLPQLWASTLAEEWEPHHCGVAMMMSDTEKLPHFGYFWGAICLLGSNTECTAVVWGLILWCVLWWLRKPSKSSVLPHVACDLHMKIWHLWLI